MDDIDATVPDVTMLERRLGGESVVPLRLTAGDHDETGKNMAICSSRARMARLVLDR